MLMSGRGGGELGGVNNGGGGYRFPFTASQWQELEHQALIFKYMVSGVPIPPDLLFTVRRSCLDSSMTLFPHSSSTSPHIGWSCFQMGLGMRKIDPEPGRCRRTDGKKWRCSKEAFQESKYCEKHMHRGKNRSRKLVETQVLSSATSTIPSSMVKPTQHSSSHYSSSVTSDHHFKHNYNHLYPPTSSFYSNIHPYHHSKGVDSVTHLGLHRVEDEHAHSLFNEDSSSWQLTPLKISSGATRSSTKAHQLQEYPPYFQFQGIEDYDHSSRTCDDIDQTRTDKTVYRFLEECPADNNNKDSSSWLNLDDKSPNCSSPSITQLSISIPTTTATTSYPQHHYLFPIFNPISENHL